MPPPSLAPIVKFWISKSSLKAFKKIFKLSLLTFFKAAGERSFASLTNLKYREYRTQNQGLRPHDFSESYPCGIQHICTLARAISLKYHHLPL